MEWCVACRSIYNTISIHIPPVAVLVWHRRHTAYYTTLILHRSSYRIASSSPHSLSRWFRRRVIVLHAIRAVIPWWARHYRDMAGGLRRHSWRDTPWICGPLIENQRQRCTMTAEVCCRYPCRRFTHVIKLSTHTDHGRNDDHLPVLSVDTPHITSLSSY